LLVFLMILVILDVTCRAGRWAIMPSFNKYVLKCLNVIRGPQETDGFHFIPYNG